MTTTKTLSLNFVPRRWQAECMAKLKRFTVLALHRRAGKTTLAVAMLLSGALMTPGNYAYMSPQKNQSRANMWDIIKAQLRPLLEYRGRSIVEIRESDLSVRFQNGSKVWLLGAEDPDKIRGAKLNGVIVDEVAQMPNEIWSEVLRPALMDTHGWALFIGTPKGINLFSEMFERGRSEKYKNEWVSYRYTCYDTDALTPAEIEAYRAEVDENTFRREMMCDFSASADDQLLSLDVVSESMSRVIEAGMTSTRIPLVMGVDVARFGSDRSTIIFRRGMVAERPIFISQSSVPDLADFAYKQYCIRRPQAVFVDGTGVGGGVVDILRAWGVPTYDINFGSRSSDPRYKNRRTEMWCNMAEWIKSGGVLFPDERLKQELCSPQYTTDEGGKICLESKKDIKRRLGTSPDFADALSLTFAEKLMPEPKFDMEAYEDMFVKPNAAKLNHIQRFELNAKQWRRRNVRSY